MLIAICDDDEYFCEELKAEITEYFSTFRLKDTILDIFHSGEELLASPKTYDIAFLDVEMAGLSGIYTGRELISRNHDIIFFIITAYDNYLDEALRFHAFRYLTKPLDKHRLFRNLKDALQVYNTRSKKIIIETKEATYTVKSTDIIMIETENRKVVIHTTENDFISINTMTYWNHTLQQLPFFQSHKSYIVNLEHITCFDNSSIHLTRDFIAYLTLRKYNEFKRVYLKYLDVTS